MNALRRHFLGLYVRILLPVALLALPLAADEPGPLEAYVSAPDDSYEWSVRDEGETNGTPFVELALTSQTWHDIVWRHPLKILRPKKLRDASRVLFLTAGGIQQESLSQPLPDRSAFLLRRAKLYAELAEIVGTPMAILEYVPQQPLFDGMMSSELIEHTFNQYLTTRDSSWPLPLPMVKSVVRGMDAVEEYFATTDSEISKFTLTGGNLGAWANWLTAAIDPRVECLAAMDFDDLNLEKRTRLQIATWGKYHREVEAFSTLDWQSWISTDEGRALRGIVDPFHYLDRVKQPKILMLATNRRDSTLDALNLFWEDMQGEKSVSYVPNQGKSDRDMARSFGMIVAIQRHATGEWTLPQLTWDYETDADAVKLSISSDKKPETVTRWLATSETRDFRRSKWQSDNLPADSAGWNTKLEYPAKGYAAMFGEAVYLDGKHRYFFSTTVRIVGPEGEAKLDK